MAKGLCGWVRAGRLKVAGVDARPQMAIAKAAGRRPKVKTGRSQRGRGPSLAAQQAGRRPRAVFVVVAVVAGGRRQAQQDRRGLSLNISAFGQALASFGLVIGRSRHFFLE